jgi:hypothetical protein
VLGSTRRADKRQARVHRADPCYRSGLTFFNTEIRVISRLEFFTVTRATPVATPEPPRAE